jgi:tetratricopeptide (TPR) repeat protein
MLDGFPSALAMAKAYMDQTAISFADYSRLYKASWHQLQRTSPEEELFGYRGRPILSTLQLSFEHIKQQSELSAQLLQLWAYFDNQDLWFELLREGSSGGPDWHGPDWLRQMTEDGLSFNQAVRVLCDHALAESAQESGFESEGYSMHSYVHLWTVRVLNKKWNAEMAGLALDCVASHIPIKSSPNSWAIQRRLLRHAARCWSFVENGMVDDNGRAWALHCLGYLFAQQGRYGDAEKMFQRALQGKEKALGPDHTSTLDTVNNLGLLYSDQGKLAEAEHMYRRALQGKEKALGVEHPLTLQTLNNLGLLYADQGKLDEAEQIYLRTLRGYEKALGPEHPSTLQTLNNLGLLYTDQGKYDMAEPLYRETLQLREKVLGMEHPQTLTSINNLARFLESQGKYDAAEPLYRETLQLREKVLGIEHPQTLTSMNNLARFLESQGKYDAAEPLYRETLQLREKVLGKEHAQTLTSMNNLALFLESQGKYNTAEPLHRETLS